MLVLHAGFRSGCLTVWGESPAAQKGSRGRKKGNPYDAGRAKLSEAFRVLGLNSRDFQEAEICLPTVRSQPLPSSPLIGEVPDDAKSKLGVWTVTTAALKSAAAVELLSTPASDGLLQPGIVAGTDFSYWATVMRFAGSLVARERFLPDLVQENGHYRARWRAAFVGRDDERRNGLASAMPSAARAFLPEQAAGTIVNEFLDAMIDWLVRDSLPAPRFSGEALHERWIAALHSGDGVLSGSVAELTALATQVRAWRRPLAALSSAPFRLCFRLEEPETDSDPWSVQYLLQGRSDPSLVLPAGAAWETKRAKLLLDKHSGFNAREHLLFSLGQAAGICPRIETSLKSATPTGYEVDAAGAHDFLTTKAMALEEAGFGVMLPAWWTRKGTKARVSAKAYVKSPFQKGSGLSLESILDFEWQISIGGEKVTLAELKALAALKAPLVKFRGQWVQMSAEEIQAALDFWRKKGVNQATARDVIRMRLGAGKPSLPIEFDGVAAEGWIADLIARLEGNAPFEEIPPPAGLQATLRPYQVRGYSWLAFVRGWGLGACLADDMGLGKTIQTLSLIQRDRRQAPNGPVLLLCPTSVAGNWQKEAARFTPDLPVTVHHGLGRAKGDAFAKQASESALVISTYALVHRDFEHLKEIRWGGIVLDEAQNIKNPETKQAIAARNLNAGFRIALTGTPVENNVGDLWSIMEFLNPGLLGSRAEFKRRFFGPIQTGRDPEASATLKKITGPFILRRLKTDRSIIADLPDKLEMKVFCTLTKEQASLYAAVVKESLKAIEETEGIQRKGIVLATLARLKQVCNHPAQYLADNSPLPGRSGKLARLTEMIEEAISVGDRVLIFTQFAEMGAMLQQHLQETFGRETLFLHGGVQKKLRDRMVERFQEETNGPPIFVLSLKAGGTGLNLTRANHVFHFDRWWNPAVENQATDRAFRIGQKKNVQVHKFLCGGTLEEKIDAMIEQKKEIAAGVVGSGESWLTELSTNQLRDLFALQKNAIGD